MATWEDVRRLALSLPGAEERTGSIGAQWRVGGKGFVWERPLRVSDHKAVDADLADGPILAARVADEGVKAALVEDEPTVFFTIPHFDGFPAILLRLDRASDDLLAEVVVDAWLARAPARLVKAHPEVSDLRPSP